jgi:hypothetical protein
MECRGIITQKCFLKNKERKKYKYIDKRGGF